MRITTEQMQGPGMPRDEYVDWFVDEFMVENLNDWVEAMGRDACRRFTNNGVRYANYFGITRDDLVAQFLYLMWSVGPDFWRFPGFSDVLARRELTQEQRINALFEVPEDQAATAIENANLDYWHPGLIEGNVIGREDPDE